MWLRPVVSQPRVTPPVFDESAGVSTKKKKPRANDVLPRRAWERLLQLACGRFGYHRAPSSRRREEDRIGRPRQSKYHSPFLKKNAKKAMSPTCVYRKTSPSCRKPSPWSVALHYYSHLSLTKETVRDLFRMNESKFTDVRSACRLLKEDPPDCSQRELAVAALMDRLVLGDRSDEITPGEIVYSVDTARKLYSPYTFHIRLISLCLMNDLIAHQKNRLLICVTTVQELFDDMRTVSPAVTKKAFLAYIAVTALIFYAVHDGSELTELSYNLSGDDTRCLGQAFTLIKRTMLEGLYSDESDVSDSSGFFPESSSDSDS